MFQTLQDAFTVYKREMLIFRSNLRTNIIRSLIFPIVFLVFFGNVGSTISHTPIAIANLANNAQAMKFVSTLEAQSALQVEALTTEQQGISMLQSGSIAVLVVITPTFPNPGSSNPTVYIYYSNAEATSLGTSISTIESIAASFGAHFNYQASQEGTVKVSSLYGTTSNYTDFLLGGIIVMVASFGSMFGAGFSLIQDRMFGTIKGFLITPITRSSFVLGKIAYGTTASLLYGLVALVVGVGLFGGSIAMGLTGVIWIMLLTAVLTVGFTAMFLMIASIVPKFEVFAILSQAVVMPLWFLSGAFSPTATLPTWMQPISAIDPMTYATNGVRSVMLTGFYSSNAILTQFSFLGIFALIATILAIKMFKTTI